MSGLGEENSTQVPLSEWVDTHPRQFRLSAPPITPLSPEGENCGLHTSSKSVDHSLSSNQQEYLLQLYLKLGGIYQEGLENVLYRFLGLMLPSSIAIATDRVAAVGQQDEPRGRSGNDSKSELCHRRVADTERNGYGEVDRVCKLSDPLLPQEWLDLVQYCWLKQGRPSLQPPLSPSSSDMYGESEHDVSDAELCSSSLFSSRSRRSSRVSGQQCLYGNLGSTVVVGIPSGHKEHTQAVASSARRLSSSIHNERNVALAGPCASPPEMEDVIAELFRKCGSTKLNKAREEGFLVPSAERHSSITLGALKRTMRQYVEKRSKPPPKPIIIDAINAMTKLAVFQEQGNTQFEKGGSYLKKENNDDDHRIVSFEDFMELLKGQMCLMQRDGVGCFTPAQAMQHGPPFSPEQFKQGAPNNSLCITRRPPTLCMLLAWIDPFNMSRIVRTEGVAYLRSVGLMEATLLFLISEAQIQLEALTNAAPPPHTPKHPNLLDAISERPMPSLPSGSGPQDANGDSGCLGPLASSPPQRVGTRKDQPRLLTVKRRSDLSTAEVQDPSYGSRSPASKAGVDDPLRQRSGSQKRYLTPRPADEITASVLARAQARRLLDTLRKNTIPIHRYECYALIGKNDIIGASRSKRAKRTKNPSGKRRDRSATPQLLQEDFMSLSRHPSDSDVLVTAQHFKGVKKATSRTPLRARTSKFAISGMFQFSGILGKKLPSKAQKAVFERLSRPVCDVHMYSVRNTTLTSTRLPRSNGDNTRYSQVDNGAKTKGDLVTELLMTPSPPELARPSSLNHRRRQERVKYSCPPALSASKPRSSSGSYAHTGMTRGEALARTVLVPEASVQNAYGEKGVVVKRGGGGGRPSSQMTGRDTPHAGFSSPLSSASVKGVCGSARDLYYAHYLTAQPVYGYQAKSSIARQDGFAATVQPSTGGRMHGRPPSGRARREPSQMDRRDWSVSREDCATLR